MLHSTQVELQTGQIIVMMALCLYPVSAKEYAARVRDSYRQLMARHFV